MKWKKIKHLFVANGEFDWMFSHASNAVFEKRDGIIDRIYFSCRDKFSRSYIAFLEINIENNFEVLSVHNKPVLTPGISGMFDDSGVVMGCLQTVNNKKYLYYLGWNLKVTVPWLNTIGVAQYDTIKNTFVKIGNSPMMDRSNEDPFSISYPSILFENGIYRMWYGSNLSWGKDQSEMQHVFKYAESKDGLNWIRTNQIVVNLEHENEYALSKPWVLKDGALYKMWYSYRANGRIDSYRIGYAESKDGFSWIRKDNEAGIDVSHIGWDSQMISYPCVFDHCENRYMLYNGNHYGKTGIGIAILEK